MIHINIINAPMNAPMYYHILSLMSYIIILMYHYHFHIYDPLLSLMMFMIISLSWSIYYPYTLWLFNIAMENNP